MGRGGGAHADHDGPGRSPDTHTRNRADAAPAPTSASDEFAQLTPAVARQLDDAIRKVLAEAKIPGVIVAVSAPGKGSTYGPSASRTRPRARR